LAGENATHNWFPICFFKEKYLLTLLQIIKPQQSAKIILKIKKKITATSISKNTKLEKRSSVCFRKKFVNLPIPTREQYYTNSKITYW
jgi:hypothetical protein